jgi:outer membrane protein assembly factor BamB
VTADGTVYAIGIPAGEEVWTFETDVDYAEYPQVLDEAVFVNPDDQVIAINPLTGDELWTFLPSSSFQGTRLSLRTFESGKYGLSEDLVLVGGAAVYGINPATGETRWSVTPGSNQTQSETEVISTTDPTQNAVIGVQNGSGQLYGVSLTTGTQIWEFATGFGAGAAYLRSGDRAIFALNSGRVIKVNDTTGRQQWDYEFGGDNRYSTVAPTSIADVDFVATANGIHALDSTTGTVNWVFEASTETDTISYILSQHGRVYLFQNGLVSAIDVETKETYWTFNTRSDRVTPESLSPFLFETETAVYRIRPPE